MSPLTPSARQILSALGAALVLALLIGGHALEQARWIELDQALPAPICCDLSGHLRDVVRMKHTGALGLEDLQDAHYPGLMSWLGLIAEPWAGTGPDLALWTQLWQTALAQLLMFALGLRLGGWLAGLTAAGLLPLMPGFALSLRSWAPFVPQMLFLIGAALALVYSRGLSRPHWALAFALIAGAGSFLSPMLTDNLLFLASAGSLAAGAGLRSLILRRGPRGEALWSRIWVLLMVLAVAGSVSWLQWEVYRSRNDSLYLFPYMFREMGLDLSALGGAFASWEPLPGHEVAVIEQVAETNGPGAWSAYSRRLYARELTAFFGIPLLVALPLYLLRGRGRAEILTGTLLPLLALSAVGKKLPYYGYLVMTFAPLITALGLAGVVRWRWKGEARTEPWWGAIPRGLIAFALLGSAAWQWTLRSFPDEHPGAADRAWEGPHFDEPRYFQYPHTFTLAPSTEAEANPIEAALLPALPYTCPEALPIRVLTAKRYWLTLEARVAEANPCAEVSGWPGDAEAEPRAIVARGVFSTRGGERRCRIPDAAAWRGEVLAARDDPGWEPIGEALQSFGGPGGCLLIYGDSSAGW